MESKQDVSALPLRDPVLIVGLGAAGSQAPLAAASLLLASAQAAAKTQSTARIQSEADTPSESTESALAAAEAGIRPEVVAEFDPDEYYDFTVARPLVHLVNGEREIEWPRAGVHRLALEDRDILFLTGVEPHYRWQRFAQSVATFARDAGVDEVILLSTFAGGTPHTRPLPLRWLPLPKGTSEPLSARFGLPGVTPQYQGPATFMMALSVMLRDAGLTVGSLNVVAPFYVGVDPNPHAVRALATAVAEEFSMPLDTARVDAQIEEVGRQAEQHMETSGELATFVRNLEQQYDDSRLLLPAGPDDRDAAPLEVDEVLADVDALLRDHRGGTGGGTGADRPRHA